MIFFDTYNPKPVPEKDLVANLEKNFVALGGEVVIDYAIRLKQIFNSTEKIYC